MSDIPQEKPKKRRQGFAALDPEQRKAIARKGGKAAHAMKLAYEWDHDAAVEAGRKGGRRTAEVYAQRIRERLGEA